MQKQEIQVWSLGQKDPLQEEMATHSSILAWETPWTEEPGGLQFMGLQAVRHGSTLEGDVPIFRDSVGPWSDTFAILIESGKDITDLFLHTKKRPREDMEKKQPSSHQGESSSETNLPAPRSHTSASRTVRKYLSVFEVTQPVVFCYNSPTCNTMEGTFESVILSFALFIIQV